MTDKAPPPSPTASQAFARIAEAKADLRRLILERRAELPEKTRILASRSLAFEGVLEAIPHGFGITSGYIAIRGEIDPALLLESFRKRGVPLALPRLAGRDIVFHAWVPGDTLEPGRYRIPEPSASAPVVRPAVMLVPLAAFDRSGNRLGYGAGFYDRAIARMRPVTIGVAFSQQEVEAVPVEGHDQPLDFILTEGGLIDCRRNRT